eukprot:gene8529-7788_t
MRKRVLVAGHSLCGMVLAINLQRAGHQVKFMKTRRGVDSPLSVVLPPKRRLGLAAPIPAPDTPGPTARTQ